MKNYDTIIVGGGVSGLYIAYSLLKKTNKKILLVERSSELGGRIRSEMMEKTVIEMGAARFSNKHKLLLSLIKELQLEDKKIKLPKEIDYYYKNKKVKYDLNKKLNRLLSNRKKYSKNYLENITLFQYCQEIFDKKEAIQLKAMFGYDAEFIKLNAYSALEMFEQDLLNGSNHYYILNGGLHQIIQKLEELLSDSKRVTIMKNSNVIDINNKQIKIKNDDILKTYKSNKLILAIPSEDLKKYELFKNYKPLNAIEGIPLLRIYAKYPLNKDGKPWFHKLRRTITDNSIRQIIPINYEEGIIMISYIDYDLANMWNNWCILGEKILTKKISEQISLLLNIKIPDPIEYKFYYWKNGVHMWKTNHSMNDLYKKIIKPFQDKNIYISNEAFCKHQCWIEGCLSMANDVIKILLKKKTIKKGGGLRKNKRNIKRKTKKINKLKKYSIEDVLKHNDWIIFEVKGKKNIYKISNKWFNQHPGGRSNLKQGVEYNSYYHKKDINRSKKSPTHLFKSIGAHGNSDVFQEYIVNQEHPDKIKLIGLLK